MGLDKIWKFLSEKWDQMPPWIKNTSYLLILGTFIYGLFVPKFIDGQLVAISPDNPELHYPLRNEVFDLDTGSRRFRLVTDNSGKFAIPKPHLLPFSTIELKFFPQGLGPQTPYFPLKVSLMGKLSGSVKIEYHQDQEAYMLAATEPALALNAIAGILVSDAFAAEAPINPELEQAVIDELKNRQTGGTEVDLDTDIHRVDNKDLSYIYWKLEKEHGVKINADNQNFQTVEDVVKEASLQMEQENWETVLENSWVKPKAWFNDNYVLKPDGTNLKIQPLNLYDDSASVTISYEENGTIHPLYSGTLLVGQRINIEYQSEDFSIKLNSIGKAGKDKIFKPYAAFFNVKKKVSIDTAILEPVADTEGAVEDLHGAETPEEQPDGQ